MGARWYDSSLGRWTQPDVIIPDPSNPLDWDRYSYVRNNSIRYSDSSGHCIDGLTTLTCITALTVFAVTYYVAYHSFVQSGGPEAVKQGMKDFAYLVSEQVSEQVDKITEATEQLSGTSADSQWSFARGDGGAEESARHLSMLLDGVEVGGFGPHPGDPDPDKRDRKSNVHGLKNTLESIKKNMRRGENIHAYLERQGWNEGQINNYVNHMKSYLEYVLENDVHYYGVEEELATELLKLAESLGF
jgi:hypothetical protein